MASNSDKLKNDIHQALLQSYLKLEDNKYCADCDAKGPRWASWNIGVFLCIRCAGIHRNLGVHISRVKSVTLDSWTPQQISIMKQMGNSRGRSIYEAEIPDNFRRPSSDVTVESFIRSKYEHKKYILHNYKPVEPNVQEIIEEVRKLENIYKKKPGCAIVVPIPDASKNIKKPEIKPAVESGKPVKSTTESVDPFGDFVSSSNENVKETVAAPQNTWTDDLLGLNFPEETKKPNPDNNLSSTELASIFNSEFNKAPTQPNMMSSGFLNDNAFQMANGPPSYNQVMMRSTNAYPLKEPAKFDLSNMGPAPGLKTGQMQQNAVINNFPPNNNSQMSAQMMDNFSSLYQMKPTPQQNFMNSVPSQKVDNNSSIYQLNSNPQPQQDYLDSIKKKLASMKVNEGGAQIS